MVCLPTREPKHGDERTVTEVRLDEQTPYVLNQRDMSDSELQTEMDLQDS